MLEQLVSVPGFASRPRIPPTGAGSGGEAAVAAAPQVPAVDVSSAPNASTLTYFGVSDRSAQGPPVLLDRD
jgi:hypothetical protein